MIRYIYTVVVVAIFTLAYVSDPIDTISVEVKQVIKLTHKHLPINRYFSDDEDDDVTVVEHSAISRRQTAIKAQTDIDETEEDVLITDTIRFRLLLARLKAMDAYDQVQGKSGSFKEINLSNKVDS